MHDILTGVGVAVTVALLGWTAYIWHGRPARWRWWIVAVGVGLAIGTAAFTDEPGRE